LCVAEVGRRQVDDVVEGRRRSLRREGRSAVAVVVVSRRAV
jgi:hypothetical protein